MMTLAALLTATALGPVIMLATLQMKEELAAKEPILGVKGKKQLANLEGLLSPILQKETDGKKVLVKRKGPMLVGPGIEAILAIFDVEFEMTLGNPPSGTLRSRFITFGTR